jgi:RNA polymerase sigma factor (TIGR02999 family)
MGGTRRAAPDVTGLLKAWSRGELSARDQVFAVAYQELKRRARLCFRREGAVHVLQPTALVHEAYLRLVKQDRVAWENRDHFYALASEMMRRILVDHARARQTDKRSGQWARVCLSTSEPRGPEVHVDVLDLHAALRELESFDPRKSRVAELRFFGGLTLSETARRLDLSVATIEREWIAARAWLYRRLKGDSDDA